jgi:threonine/homoserine/homoserine lactone efflux protein
MALGQFSPGPDMVLLTRVSLAHGRKAGWVVAVGIATGLMLHAGLAVGGVALLIQSSEWVYIALNIVAASYLVYLGWNLVRALKQTLYSSELSTEKAGLHFWRMGFLCNVLNPKVAIILASIVTPYLSARSELWWPFVLWATIWIEGLILWCLWSSVLQQSWIREKYLRVQKWIDVAFGIALWSIAVVLLIRLL